MRGRRTPTGSTVPAVAGNPCLSTGMYCIEQTAPRPGGTFRLMASRQPTDEPDPRLLLRCLDVLSDELHVMRRRLLNPDDEPDEQTPEAEIA